MLLIPKRTRIIIGTVVVLAIIAAVAYYAFVMPNSATKPNIAKPALGDTIKPENVNWLVNELGAYKLHSSLTGDPAKVEVLITDKMQIFTVTVNSNMPSTLETPVENPDISISLEYASFAELYNSSDFNAKMLELYNSGEAKIIILADPATLAIKGYKSLYDGLGLQV